LFFLQQQLHNLAPILTQQLQQKQQQQIKAQAANITTKIARTNITANYPGCKSRSSSLSYHQAAGVKINS
jgi:hypothetical protein